MENNNKQSLMKVALGGITENPTFIMALDMCPTLAMTNELKNALGLSLATLVVLILSNVILSALGKLIPDKVRIPCYIIIISTLVTLISFLMQRFLPDLYKQISLFVALITVNCIILGRVEAFAAKNNPLYALVDGISMGLGFVAALCLLGTLREIIGAGTILGFRLIPEQYTVSIFTHPIGGFLMLGILMALFNAVYAYVLKKQKAKKALELKKEKAA